MGRSLVAEETVRERIQGLFGTVRSSQLGLVIGQRAGTKDYISLLVPTPADGTNEEVPSVDWALEHATQVERMLPSGFEIIGLFLYAAPSTAQRLQGQVRQLAYELCNSHSLDRSVCQWSAKTSLASAHSASAVIIQICSSTKKTVCRTLDVQDRQATLKPAELKYQSFLRSWAQVSCTYALDETIFTEASAHGSSPSAQVLSNMKQVTAQLNSAAAAVVSDRGRLFRKLDEPLVARSSGRGAAVHSPTIQLELWSGGGGGGADVDDAIEVRSCSDCLRVRGNICARSYVHDKATFREAVDLLKLDVLRSITTRLHLLSEDAQDMNEDGAAQASDGTEKKEKTATAKPRQQQVLICPERCFGVIDSASPIAVCDYLFPGELVSACAQRVSDMLGTSLKDDSFVRPESMPSSQAEALKIIGSRAASKDRQSAAAAATGGQGSADAGKVAPRGSSCTTIVGAVLVAAIAGISSLVLSSYQ
ncbi:protein odr-4 homolog [Sycon ciliatum]|uniref:protein odr-4 homolog n=1 Tax=Sycon ciliatum TaxID=27933 RepID=UPI0020AA35D7|eukprot:scpid18087/ scgid18409/ Protein odr-4 homolog